MAANHQKLYYIFSSFGAAFHLKYRVAVELFWCVLARSLLCLIYGRYRSATAPLVSKSGELMHLIDLEIIGCRSISAKPTSIQKEKDIPKLPENYKKLYQYFRLFYFHSHNNIAVISLLLHVVDTYQTRITPQYIFIQILRILYVALPCTEPD